jgi:hypothetical protein
MTDVSARSPAVYGHHAYVYPNRETLAVAERLRENAGVDVLGRGRPVLFAGFGVGLSPEAGQKFPLYRRRACFETHPGCAGTLLSMTLPGNGIKQRSRRTPGAHPAVALAGTANRQPNRCSIGGLLFCPSKPAMRASFVG